MKSSGISALALLVTVVLMSTLRAAFGPREPERPPLAATPAASTPIEILHAQPFVLDQPYVHEWRREKPLATAGTILVLSTEPELVRPRQTAEPVLYVGAETAERVNAPRNGNLVVLVPGPVDDDGRVDLDLSSTTIWFGTPDLPERVDAAVIARELARAQASGAGPARLSERARLRSAADATIYARDRVELDPYLADLIELYSPEEVDLARGLRVPVSR